jgi:hypothetical protein
LSIWLPDGDASVVVRPDIGTADAEPLTRAQTATAAPKAEKNFNILFSLFVRTDAPKLTPDADADMAGAWAPGA